MALIRTFYQLFEKIAQIVTKISSFVVFLSLLLLVLDLGAGVILRYVFEYIPAWYEDAAKIFLVWLAFSGAIVAFDRGEHVSIHIFGHSMPRFFKILLALIVQLLIILTAFFVVKYGYNFALSGMRGVFPSLDFLPLSAAYAAVPFGYAGIMLISIRNILRLFVEPDAVIALNEAKF